MAVERCTDGHTWEVVKHHSFQTTCQWHPRGKWKFSRGVKRWSVLDHYFYCNHYQRCAVCGKYGDPLPVDQCPDYTQKPELEDA